MLTSARDRSRSMAKTVAFHLLGSPPIVRQRLERVKRSGVTTILNLHSVAPSEGGDYSPLHPALFDELLSFVKREFAVLRFGELGERTSKPKLVLSFDDGYRDFIRYAVPTLKRHGLSANQNVIPRCIETGLPPLNVMAREFVSKAPAELVDRLHVEGFSSPRDAHFGRRLSHFLKMRPQAEQDRLAERLLPQFRAWDKFNPIQMMTAEEIRSLDGIEIGAHSYSHSSMEYETDEFLEQDVRRCSAFFRDRLAIPMTIYAFPNGSCRPGQAEKVAALGVEHVLLVGERFDRGRQIHHRFTFEARSRAELRYKALGRRAA